MRFEVERFNKRRRGEFFLCSSVIEANLNLMTEFNEFNGFVIKKSREKIV